MGNWEGNRQGLGVQERLVGLSFHAAMDLNASGGGEGRAGLYVGCGSIIKGCLTLLDNSSLPCF